MSGDTHSLRQLFAPSLVAIAAMFVLYLLRPANSPPVEMITTSDAIEVTGWLTDGFRANVTRIHPIREAHYSKFKNSYVARLETYIPRNTKVLCGNGPRHGPISCWVPEESAN